MEGAVLDYAVRAAPGSWCVYASKEFFNGLLGTITVVRPLPPSAVPQSESLGFVMSAQAFAANPVA